MKRKFKYKNYRELADAFASGELDRKKYFLMLDKGSTENRLCYRYETSESEEDFDQKSEECEKLFDGDRPVEELFEALGIPTEPC